MARHDQKPYQETHKFVCTECKVGACTACIDVARRVYTDCTICRCSRVGHSGEPRDRQIADPETETIHAPAATVTKDGEVTVDEQFKRDFIKLFDV